MPRERDKRWFIVIRGKKSDKTGEIGMDADFSLISPGMTPAERREASPIIEGWDRVNEIIKFLSYGRADTAVEVREVGPPLRRLTYEMTVQDVDLREGDDEQGQKEQETAEPS